MKLSKMGNIRMDAMVKALEKLCDTEDDLVGIGFVTLWRGNEIEPDPSVLSAVRVRSDVISEAAMVRVALAAMKERAKVKQ